jgi:AcrR family transcriptional regulator
MSPRTPKQFEEIREEKKTLIMNVALEHFANEGFHSTTINHIAKHAGISKGLMYNYFESKEKLLSEIINRSVSEIYLYFDPDRDGYLSEEEFELFIRKVFLLLREKWSFWRLFFHLLMQKDVRDQFLKSYIGSSDSIRSISATDGNSFLSGVIKMITEYFIRKRDRKRADYDPEVELNMFIYALMGFAVTTIYLEDSDKVNYEKTVNKIIELYK